MRRHPNSSPQATTSAEAALAAQEIQRKQAALLQNKQNAVDAKRAAEELGDSTSGSEHEEEHEGDGKAAIDHLKTADAVRQLQLESEQLKLKASAAELETAKISLQAARAKKAASEAMVEEALEDDKAVLAPEAAANLITLACNMQAAGFPSTTNILDVPKIRHALRRTDTSEGGLAHLVAPVHNGTWQRLGRHNFTTGRLTAKEATGGEKLHTLQAYLPSSKNRKKGHGAPSPPLARAGPITNANPPSLPTRGGVCRNLANGFIANHHCPATSHAGGARPYHQDAAYCCNIHTHEFHASLRSRILTSLYTGL